MTSLFSKIKETIKADFAEGKAKHVHQNPIALLNHYLKECEAEVERVEKLVDRQRRLKQEFEREHQEAAEMVEKRKKHVELARESGQEDVSAYAEKELVYYEEREERLTLTIQEVHQQLVSLEEKHSEMKHKLKDMYLKRLELMGQENVMRAEEKAGSVLGKNGTTDRFKEIEFYLAGLKKGTPESAEERSMEAKLRELERSADSHKE